MNTKHENNIREVKRLDEALIEIRAEQEAEKMRYEKLEEENEEIQEEIN